MIFSSGIQVLGLGLRFTFGDALETFQWLGSFRKSRRPLRTDPDKEDPCCNDPSLRNRQKPCAEGLWLRTRRVGREFGGYAQAC